MDYSIDWSESALDDLKDLVCYIAADNPVAAEHFGEAIIKRVEALSSFPRAGRIVPEFSDDLLREVIWTPYRIVYEVNDTCYLISVIRIWHGARGELEI
ncbi:MAG: type II toxin-antitoxin system RelE/ParE family toxin [Verrucomicrobiales bacterium]|nr:type II toxin-antitoxin system RelE/ParE family toxin [Verrucomicrobiales bacterium]